MSVASKNPFALLDEESTAPANTNTAQSKSAPKPPQAPQKDAQKARTGPASRGGKYYNRGGKPSAPKDSAATTAEDAPVDGQKRFDGPRGRGRGRGGRGRGGDRPPRGRQYDRHSQTGRTDSDKQVHQSWGGDDGAQELQVEVQAEKDAAVEASQTPAAEGDGWGTGEVTDWGNGAAANDQPKEEGRPPRREREPEEEDNTLTFDQYLAQKKESDIIPKLAGTRQANEGQADDIWKNTVQLQKNEEEENYFIGKTKSAPKSRAKKEEKVYLEIDARFDRPSRGRGGDRGRGDRGRGGRGRGGRGNAPTTTNVDVADESAFPSLS